MKKEKPLSEKSFWIDNSKTHHGKYKKRQSYKSLKRFYYKDVAEHVKKSEERILDLSILEINKDLNVSEVVKKTLDIIKEEFGEFK